VTAVVEGLEGVGGGVMIDTGFVVACSGEDIDNSDLEMVFVEVPITCQSLPPKNYYLSSQISRLMSVWIIIRYSIRLRRIHDPQANILMLHLCMHHRLPQITHRLLRRSMTRHHRNLKLLRRSSTVREGMLARMCRWCPVRQKLRCTRMNH